MSTYKAKNYIIETGTDDFTIRSVSGIMPTPDRVSGSDIRAVRVSGTELTLEYVSYNAARRADVQFSSAQEASAACRELSGIRQAGLWPSHRPAASSTKRAAARSRSASEPSPKPKAKTQPRRRSPLRKAVKWFFIIVLGSSLLTSLTDPPKKTVNVPSVTPVSPMQSAEPAPADDPLGEPMDWENDDGGAISDTDAAPLLTVSGRGSSPIQTKTFLVPYGQYEVTVTLQADESFSDPWDVKMGNIWLNFPDNETAQPSGTFTTAVDYLSDFAGREPKEMAFTLLFSGSYTITVTPLAE